MPILVVVVVVPIVVVCRIATISGHAIVISNNSAITLLVITVVRVATAPLVVQAPGSVGMNPVDSRIRLRTPHSLMYAAAAKLSMTL